MDYCCRDIGHDERVVFRESSQVAQAGHWEQSLEQGVRNKESHFPPNAMKYQGINHCARSSEVSSIF